MSAYLSPLLNENQLDANGDPISGGKIYWYVAGTTTPQDTYTDETATTPQANPVILNSRGISADAIWLKGGASYKAVFNDADDNPIAVYDNIVGINDPATAPTISEWLAYTGAPTFIGATSFSVVGDQTAIFTPRRKIKATAGAGSVYGWVATSVFGAGITTITITKDTGSQDCDSSLTGLYYALMSSSAPGPSIPNIGVNEPGTVMLFAQAAAPTGWVQITSDFATNRFLRVVNDGTGGATGGTDDPTAGVTKVASHDHTLSGTTGNDAPDHTHNVPNVISISGSGVAVGAGASQYTTPSVGASTRHTHSFSTRSDPNSGAAVTIFRYANLIMCSKA